jgi:hypothetical protein
MKKTKTITLNYVNEKGEELKQPFDIFFISNGMIREFNEINAVIAKVGESWRKYSKAMNQIENDKIKLDTAAIKKLTGDAVKEYEEIKGINSADFFKKRAALCIAILKRNKHADKELFLNMEFWDDSVEPDELNDFLKECINKDLGGLKKKIPEKEKSSTMTD